MAFLRAKMHFFALLLTRHFIAYLQSSRTFYQCVTLFHLKKCRMKSVYKKRKKKWKQVGIPLRHFWSMTLFSVIWVKKTPDGGKKPSKNWCVAFVKLRIVPIPIYSFWLLGDSRVTGSSTQRWSRRRCYSVANFSTFSKKLQFQGRKKILNSIFETDSFGSSWEHCCR